MRRLLSNTDRSGVKNSSPVDRRPFSAQCPQGEVHNARKRTLQLLFVIGRLAGHLAADDGTDGDRVALGFGQRKGAVVTAPTQDLHQRTFAVDVRAFPGFAVSLGGANLVRVDHGQVHP